MKKYRIKVNTLNNGRTQYTPQVGYPKCFGLYIKWFNILTYPNHFTPDIGETTCMWYDTEGEALSSIEIYQKYILIIDGKKTKSTTYKNL